MVIYGHWWSLVVIDGHLWSLMVISCFLNFGFCFLEFVWNLVLGIWNLPCLWCLGFGIFSKDRVFF